MVLNKTKRNKTKIYKTKTYKTKKNILCNNLSFSDCEIAVLRQAIDKAEEKQGKRKIESPEIKKIINIVEDFIKKKKLIVYGGLAINNILPKEDQFYNKEIEVPDYDFFSFNALNDAKELTNIFFQNGFEEVEAKSGQHHGTYKVFVNFMGIADITYLSKELFNSLKKDAKKINGIYYAPPNYLRMGMYLELSRPDGDVSRWEKVLKRLILLNKHYPLKNKQCLYVSFQRNMENKDNEEIIYETTKNTLIEQGVVFFGGYALSLYSRYMPNYLKKKIEEIPDFDVLSEEPLKTAEIVKERLNEANINKVKIIKHNGIGEIIAPHYEIKVGNDTIAFIYQPLACHSYNEIYISNNKIKIASIDTMLSFYLAFMYSTRPYYDKDRILCMASYLFKVQEKNRLVQKGLLKRFSINCFGHQETLEEMRSIKTEKYNLLKKDPNSLEYEEWFLRYRPIDIKKRKIILEKRKKKKEKVKKKK